MICTTPEFFRNQRQNAHCSRASSGSTKWLFVSAWILGFPRTAGSINVELTSLLTSSDGNDGSQNKWSEDIAAQIVPSSSMTDSTTAKSAQTLFATYGFILSSLFMRAGLVTGIIVVVLLLCALSIATYSYRRHRCRSATSRSFEDKNLGRFPEPAGVNSNTRIFSFGKALRLVIGHLVLSKGKSEVNNSEGPNAPSRPWYKGGSLSSRLRMHWLNEKEFVCVNKLKLYVESWSGEAWDWWPLCPSLEQPGEDESGLILHNLNGLSTLPWLRHTENRKTFRPRHWSVLEEANPQSTANEGDFWQSQSTSEPSRARSAITGGLPSERPFQATSNGNSSCHSDNDDVSRKGMDPSAPITAVDIVPPSNFTGFILFGVHGSQRLQSAYLRLAQIDVLDKDDDGFFDQMIVEFGRLRGFLRRTFSIWVFHTCDFITVRLSD